MARHFSTVASSRSETWAPFFAIDVGHLLVVGHRLLGPKLLKLTTHGHDDLLLILRQGVENLFDITSGSSMNQ